MKALSGDIEKRNGEGDCYIMDGLDEYHCQDNKDSYQICQLLDKIYLSKSIVIVTSRPAAAVDLNESVLSKRIETFSYSKEQILEYIDNFPFANSWHPSVPTLQVLKTFDALCFLAYSMSIRKFQVISREELSREFSLDVSSNDSWSLGLVTVQHSSDIKLSCHETF